MPVQTVFRNFSYFSYFPYWYRYRWQDGKMHKRYVGKTLPQSLETAADTPPKPQGKARVQPGPRGRSRETTRRDEQKRPRLP